MTPEERQKLLQGIASETKKLAQPIDFNELESKGIITKEGAWYRVNDFNALPEHARVKVSSMSQDSRGIKVKFKKSSSFDKYAKQFEKLGL